METCIIGIIKRDFIRFLHQKSCYEVKEICAGIVKKLTTSIISL